MRRNEKLEERSLIGLEARGADGAVIGRISDVVTDEETGDVTHVVVERDGGEEVHMPISEVSLDPEADFARYRADRSDAEPGDHVEDDVEPQGYAPAESETEDREHEGQFVTTPQDPAEAVSPAQEESTEAAEASGWEDEGTNTPESGYPRNDVYIDPDTGEEVVDPSVQGSDTLRDSVEDLINGTGLEVRSVKDGVVELSGRATAQEDLDASVEEIRGLDGVVDIDTTDVDVG
jgi:sporulation protein YlmC with PRC-barrel domain